MLAGSRRPALPQQPAAAATTLTALCRCTKLSNCAVKEELWKIILVVCVRCFCWEFYRYLRVTGSFGRREVIMSYQQYMNMGEFGGLGCCQFVTCGVTGACLACWRGLRAMAAAYQNLVIHVTGFWCRFGDTSWKWFTALSFPTSDPWTTSFMSHNNTDGMLWLLESCVQIYANVCTSLPNVIRWN